MEKSFTSLDTSMTSGLFANLFLAVALASIAAPLLIGSLGERVSWSTGFVASGIAMTGAVIVYGRGSAAQPPASAPESPTTEGIGAKERQRIAVLLLLLPMIVQPNFQMSNAYLVWGDRSFALVALAGALGTDCKDGQCSVAAPWGAKRVKETLDKLSGV
jgi:POT family proton-dependent oligopeptide transporter